MGASIVEIRAVTLSRARRTATSAVSAAAGPPTNAAAVRTTPAANRRHAFLPGASANIIRLARLRCPPCPISAHPVPITDLRPALARKLARHPADPPWPAARLGWSQEK